MSDARFDQLKSKYAPVLAKISALGIKLENLHLQDDKLVIKARAKTHGDSDLVWDEIKRVSPSYQSDLSAQIQYDAEGPASTAKAATTAPAKPVTQVEMRTHTVAAGETLSKIAQQFYGDAKSYMRIFEANRDRLSDPDLIKPGQVLKIPTA